LGELALPRESAAAAAAATAAAAEEKKPRKLTRLLRTPLSGGVVSNMNRDLPSVAVAARNLMELAAGA